MSLRSRQEVIERLRRNYQAAGPTYRTKLIDELCCVGGYARNYAIKVLNGKRPGPRGRRRGGRRPRYGPGELEVIATIWKLGDYPCGKRLVAMRPLWRWAYEQHHGRLGEELRQNLQQISAATLARRLAPRRHQARAAVAHPDSRALRQLELGPSGRLGGRYRRARRRQPRR